MLPLTFFPALGKASSPYPYISVALILQNVLKNLLIPWNFSPSPPTILFLLLICYNSLLLPIPALYLCLTSPTSLWAPWRQDLHLHLLNGREFTVQGMRCRVCHGTLYSWNCTRSDSDTHPTFMASLIGNSIVVIIQTFPPSSPVHVPVQTWGNHSWKASGLGSH